MRKFGLLALVLVLGTLFIFAENKPVAAPTFTADQLRDFFKVQSQVNQAELALERTKEYQNQVQIVQQFQKLTQDMNKFCGAGFNLALTQQGDPICSKAPEEKKGLESLPVEPAKTKKEVKPIGRF